MQTSYAARYYTHADDGRYTTEAEARADAEAHIPPSRRHLAEWFHMKPGTPPDSGDPLGQMGVVGWRINTR